MPRELVLHRYTITIDARYDKDGKQLPEPIKQETENVYPDLAEPLGVGFGVLKRKLPLPTDFKSTLICLEKNSQSLWGPEIEYFHENDNAPGSDAQIYQLRIEETLPTLKISELKESWPSTDVGVQASIER
ncbi:hypothetical protein HO173_009546 [Letharia columbiana]|uniref:Uncharacterized protein n=1 Tax=Letharia columbiana TaxID=112416 RepID=A0A8H6FP91_9LECA|nr:uncharacterized protein HO173_009546 [Letharia columbiana]KAF6232163.1 hypothetical protein HO173_009546 [Letharia columbiana]